MEAELYQRAWDDRDRQVRMLKREFALLSTVDEPTPIDAAKLKSIVILLREREVTFPHWRNRFVSIQRTLRLHRPLESPNQASEVERTGRWTIVSTARVCLLRYAHRLSREALLAS